MRDLAGNYTFTFLNNTYTIMRMGWREQREFIGVLKKALNNNGELEPFSDGFNQAQDWLLEKIALSSGSSLQYLKGDFLDIHLESFTDSPIEIVNGIFSEAVRELTENFIQNGSRQNNSSQEPEKSSKSQSSQSRLSKTLSK